MENKNLNNSLFYGNIVKLESTSKELLNDILFFIDYIDSSKIILISETMVPQVFYLNSNGGIDNIDKIILIHQQEEGYCVINRLFPGKLVKINFSNENSIIQGQITKLENDMIVIKTTDNETLYIDFEYSGLLEKYNILSIDVIKNYENLSNNENRDILDNDVIEESGTMYSIEQQINDFIEKSRLTTKNKNQVMVEIQKYKTLLEEYTNLEKGIKINKIPNNQLLYSLFNLNPKVVNLFSYYLHKELYYNDEKAGDYEFDNIEADISTWQYSVIEKKYKNELEDFSKEVFEPNIIPVNVKLKDYHKKIKLKTEQNVAIINKIPGSKDLPFFFAIGKEGVINLIPYDMIHLDSDNKLIANGIVFKTLPEISAELNTHKSSNILSKSIQNLEYKNEKIAKIRMMSDDIMKEKKYFDNNKRTFYEFQENKNFKETLEDLNIELENLKEHLFEKNEVSIYQCLKKMTLFDISKLNTKEFLFIQSFIKDNINAIKRSITEKRNNFIKLNKNSKDYVYVPHENMYEIIKNSYLLKDSTNNSKSSEVDYHMGELLNIASIDNMELLMFELNFLNKENNINFNDTEINAYILDLQAKINGEVSKINQEEDIEYSKYYEKKSDMDRDSKSKMVILGNVHKVTDNNGNSFYNQKYDVIQYLYETVIANTKFNGTIDEFISNLNLFLKFMHQDNNEVNDFDIIFANEKEQEEILSILIKHIQEKQIRKYDKCYVGEEKKFYIFNGSEFVSTENFNDALSKKKLLQVKNSIDEFEDIKTKIINDSLIKYIRKNESDIDKDILFNEMNKEKIKRKIKSIKYNKLKLLLKYNKQKEEYEKLFDNMNFDELQHYSPHVNLLHSILAIDDLERKYSLIQRFISSFTIDQGDPKWFFCVKKNTKLMPKYLQKLSEAYLLYNTHDSVMKEICLQEGYISESGDSWIHKESGFVIKKIDFDTNYGYDENGFKIKLDTIEGIEVEQSEVVKSEPKIKPHIDKNVFLLIKEITKAMMSELSIKFKTIDQTDVIYTTMGEIFEMSLLHPKYEKLELIGIIYLVLSVLLVYVQCKNINVDQSYSSSCNLSFSGFPYEDNEGSLEGIEYLACYLYKRINRTKDSKDGKRPKKVKLSNASKILFSKFTEMSKSEQDIKNDLIEYIKYFLLKNDFIQNMISQKRNFEQKHPNTEYLSKPLILFKPALVNITTKDGDESFVHNKNNFREINEKMKRELDMVNMKIEEKVKSTVKEELPLLKNHFQETFLINFCCQDKELALRSLIHSGKDKTELSNLVKRSDDLFEIISIENLKCLKGTSMIVPITNYEEEIIDNTRIYNDATIYAFLLDVFNLQSNSKKNEIPKHLQLLAKEINIDQVKDEFYTEMMKMGKEGTIEIKKQLLEKYGIEFSLPFMIRVMNEHHLYQYEEEKELKKKQAEKISNIQANTKTKVLSDFNFEFVESINSDNLGVGLRDGDFLLGQNEATVENNVNAVSRVIEKENKSKKISHGEQVLDKFNNEIEVFSQNYNKFMTTNLNSQNYRKTKNRFKTLLVNLKNGIYLENRNNEQFELYLKQLYNINNHLITLIPGLLVNNEFHNTANFEQFDYAEKHINDLIEHCQEYKKGIDKLIDPSEETIEMIKSITEHKEIFYMKKFNKKRSEYYSFMLYLFYKIMNYYIRLKEPVEVLVNVNFEIINLILNYIKNTSYLYENMITSHKQSKQSEKSIKTEMLRKMKPGEREAETYKMAAKLGDWSYGNQSRVFKYYKQFYAEDSEKANEIKNIAQELYSTTITSGENDIYDDPEFENSFTGIIMNEETENINMIPDEDGIVYDEQGCEIDDYE